MAKTYLKMETCLSMFCATANPNHIWLRLQHGAPKLLHIRWALMRAKSNMAVG